jgi:dihydroxy-acid dehydratase
LHGRGLRDSAAAAAIPAVDSRKKVMAQLSGRRIVEMVKKKT